MDCTQIVLVGRGCSGRGVRLRTLSPTERDQASILAAKIVGKDGITAEFVVAETREMVERCIIAVTKKTGLRSPDDVLALQESDWEQLTQEKLRVGAQWDYARVFTASDDYVLTRLVRRLHTATEDDVDAILGKALTLSLG